MNFKQLFRTKNVTQVMTEAKEGLHVSEHNIAMDESVTLRRSLKVRDLTAFGIAAIVGAGIFSTIGTASANGGPAITLLFVFIAIACGFSALSYAEFSSLVPISGSAYTYAYVSFGELIAWIIGWDLLMEYAIGNIAVAISWSDYFTGLLSGLGINMPAYFTMDFLTAWRGFESGDATSIAYQAWTTAPQIFGLHLVMDLPALGIVFIITYLVYIGIRESRTASNLMVLLKLIVVIMVIVVGAFYINPANWSPFAPHGMKGVMLGVSSVFFAYIGFDAISTTAEECENPQRDLPRGMFYSLIICTILYVAIALVLTGMVNYSELAVGDPLAFVFAKLNLNWLSGVVAVSAIVAMASVLLVFQLGQPRIWMSMSRDGLLPPIFARIHPKFKTPSFSTILTGLLVAIPALFLNLTEVTDLTSIGTLFAFVLVNAGVLIMQSKKGYDTVTDENAKRFRMPYINGKYIVPALYVIGWIAVYYFNAEGMHNFFSSTDANNPGAGWWEVFRHKIPMWLFIILSTGVTYISFTKALNALPVMGLFSCFYLMTELGITNWYRFVIWLIIGLIIYFIYSHKHSKLNTIS